MIYKIRTMNGADIAIESDEDLIQFLTKANAGKKLIITKHGVVNVASIDSITAHDDMNRVLGEKLRYQEVLPDGSQKPKYTPEEALKDTVGSSPFAKLLSNKMGMLTPQERTEAQEEANRAEIRGKEGVGRTSLKTSKPTTNNGANVRELVKILRNAYDQP